MFSLALFVRGADPQHLIYTVMAYLLRDRVITDHIIVLIIPDKRPWADVIPCPIMAQYHFFFYIPLKILKFNTGIRINRRVYLIHVIVDTLVHCFYAPGDQYLAVKLLRLMTADKAL